MYNLNEFVKITKTTEIKQIIDYEIIDNIVIYYMDDGTSFSEKQLQKLNQNNIPSFIRLIKFLFVDKKTYKRMCEIKIIRKKNEYSKFIDKLKDDEYKLKKLNEIKNFKINYSQPPSLDH